MPTESTGVLLIGISGASLSYYKIGETGFIIIKL